MFRPAMRASFITALSLAAQFGAAQEGTVRPDLSEVQNSALWSISNREVKIGNRDDRACVELDAKPGDGIVWLNDLELTNGIIEADIRGSDAQGRSFVGIAFRGVDENTYDAVYFRPFNFASTDATRKGHSVQYISQPDYPWYRLRDESPGVYENALNTELDPNSFFHVKIIVEKPKIRVFVNDAEDPCLVVDELTDRSSGWVGLWTGNNSDGAFADLSVTPGNTR